MEKYFLNTLFKKARLYNTVFKKFKITVFKSTVFKKYKIIVAKCNQILLLKIRIKYTSTERILKKVIY